MKLRVIVHDFRGNEHLVTVRPGEKWEAIIPVKLEDVIVEVPVAQIEFLGVFDDDTR